MEFVDLLGISAIVLMAIIANVWVWLIYRDYKDFDDRDWRDDDDE